MQYPVNVETALSVEQVVRDNGAIPATIAIIQGRIKIGNLLKWKVNIKHFGKVWIGAKSIIWEEKAIK